jgi:hypothetical protein
VENGASPPRGAPPPVSPEHPLVCCLSFALSSLPLCLFLTLSRRLTPLTDHWPHRDTGHQLFFFLSFFSFFFLSSPSFSLLFSDSLQLYKQFFFFLILLLISLFQ